MSILSTTLLSATNALLWGLPSGKWAALAADKTADLYDRYLRRYQEEFERLIGARIKQIEVSRTQDQNGKIVLVFKNVSVIDFEKFLKEVDEKAEGALDSDLRQRLKEGEEALPKKAQNAAVKEKEVAADGKETTESAETKVADTVYYNVTLTVDPATTLGEVDFGDWKKANFGCEVVKQGDNAELTEDERDAVINTLRCYSKLTKKEGFLPQDAINDRIVIADKRWVIGWFFNWWHTDKDHAVKQYVDEEKPAPDHVREEKFINSLKELAIAKGRPDLIEGYHQMSQNSLILRKERNKELITKYQKQYDDGLAAQRRYRRVVIGATIAAVLVVAAVVALGIAFPTVGVSLLSATLGGIATGILALGKNLDAWLIGGAVTGFFGKFVPEYNAETLLITRRKLEIQQQLEVELEKEEQELDGQKRHDLELVEICLGAEKSKKLDFSNTDLTPSEIDLVIRKFVEKDASLNELTIKMQDFVPREDVSSKSAILTFNDILTKSQLSISTLSLTALNPMDEASFKAVLAMVQKNCLLTQVNFDWQPRGIDLPQPIDDIIVQIRQETLLNKKILEATTPDDLAAIPDAKDKLLNNFDLAVCSENAGELVQHVVEQNRCLKQLIADKLPANGAALLQEAAQIEGLQGRFSEFWQQLGDDRQNILVTQIKDQIKSGQVVNVELLQLFYPSLPRTVIEAVNRSFNPTELTIALDNYVQLMNGKDANDDWRRSLIENISVLSDNADIQVLIRMIIGNAEGQSWLEWFKGLFTDNIVDQLSKVILVINQDTDIAEEIRQEIFESLWKNLNKDQLSALVTQIKGQIKQLPSNQVVNVQLLQRCYQTLSKDVIEVVNRSFSPIELMAVLDNCAQLMNGKDANDDWRRILMGKISTLQVDINFHDLISVVLFKEGTLNAAFKEIVNCGATTLLQDEEVKRLLGQGTLNYEILEQYKNNPKLEDLFRKILDGKKLTDLVRDPQMRTSVLDFLQRSEWNSKTLGDKLEISEPWRCETLSNLLQARKEGNQVDEKLFQIVCGEKINGWFGSYVDYKQLIDMARDPKTRSIVLDFLQQVEWDNKTLGERLEITESWRCDLLNQLLALRKENPQLDETIFQMVWGEKNGRWKSWVMGEVSYVQLSELISAIENDQGIEDAKKMEVYTRVCQPYYPQLAGTEIHAVVKSFEPQKLIETLDAYKQLKDGKDANDGWRRTLMQKISTLQGDANFHDLISVVLVKEGTLNAAFKEMVNCSVTALLQDEEIKQLLVKGSLECRLLEQFNRNNDLRELFIKVLEGHNLIDLAKDPELSSSIVIFLRQLDANSLNKILPFEDQWRNILLNKLLNDRRVTADLINTVISKETTLKMVFKQMMACGLKDLLKQKEVKQLLGDETLSYELVQYIDNPEMEDLFKRVLEGQKLIDLARNPVTQPSVLKFLQKREWGSKNLGARLEIPETWRCEMLNQLLQLRKNGTQINDRLFQMVWGEKKIGFNDGIPDYKQLPELITAIQQQALPEKERQKAIARILNQLLTSSEYNEKPPRILMDIIQKCPDLLKNVSLYPRLISAVKSLVEEVEWPFVEELFRNMSRDTLTNLEKLEGFPWFGRKLVDNLGSDEEVNKIDLPKEVWLKYFEFCGIKPAEAALKADWVSKLFNNFESLTDKVKYVLYWSISWGTGSLSWTPYWNCAQMQAELNKIDPDWQEKYLNKQPTKNLDK